MKRIDTFEPISKRVEETNLHKLIINYSLRKRRRFVSLISSSKSINIQTSKTKLGNRSIISVVSMNKR